MDDIIFGGDDKLSEEFVEAMKKELKISIIREIKFFIGLQVSQLKRGIFIGITKYVKEVIKKFGMEEEKLVGTPMVSTCKLSKEDEILEVTETLYWSMIGKLQYVVHNRLEITQVANIVARVLANLKESHMLAMKRIFRYLKGTKEYGLWYPYKGTFKFSVFTNYYWAGDKDDMKSIIGGAFFLGGILVAWTNKK